MTLATAMRQQVLSVDREQPVSEVRTMEQVLGGSLARQKFAMLLLALVLAAVGLYGVLSYSVAQRTREIGLRVALGAARWHIFRLILQQGMRAAALGIYIPARRAIQVDPMVALRSE